MARGGHIAGPWIDASGDLPLFAGQLWVAPSEEFGWRGFALPRLQSRIGPLPAALVIGMLWSAWHLPMFFVRGAPQYGQSFLEFCYVITAASLVMTALYNRAGKSLIVTILFHGALNAWYFVFNVPDATNTIMLSLYIPIIAVAIAALRRPFAPIPIGMFAVTGGCTALRG